MADNKYIKFDDPAVEPAVNAEAQLQKELFRIIKRTQEHNFSMHRHAFRATHVKTQAIVKGTLTITPDLPAELAHGIASPENAKHPHPIAMRFANEPSFLQDDRAPGPRGCGMKIFDVAGTFMDDIGTKTRTQDLTFNNAPILELRDLPTTLQIFTIRERHFRNPDEIASDPYMQERDDLELQQAPMQLPNRHFLSYVMYSQSAYCWGPYVAKYALFPTGQYQSALEESHRITEGSSPEQHSEWLKEWFNGERDATYDLRVQLCEDVGVQSVEDASVQWDEGRYPFRTVGSVVLPVGQDVFGAERRAFWDDGMKLNVWYGLEEHRPLGSVNRLRRELYANSVAFRGDMNAKEVRAVGSVDEIP
ncbi:hypothetical protein OHC33_001489 [Knufia fluminis]|uniref:Catalase n=1 Tax=Knufia fluminis TaxID=191047 RepID=A0AAN8EVU5_9EURO|nr:hypothetical protein OHC33_001489 [Knufia fluminis]